jgi:hypothetical protein
VVIFRKKQGLQNAIQYCRRGSLLAKGKTKEKDAARDALQDRSS